MWYEIDTELGLKVYQPFKTYRGLGFNVPGFRVFSTFGCRVEKPCFQ